MFIYVCFVIVMWYRIKFLWFLNEINVNEVVIDVNKIFLVWNKCVIVVDVVVKVGVLCLVVFCVFIKGVYFDD